MVDIFLVLLLPTGGDELQGIKKGIIEIADLIIVNKADGKLIGSAEITKSEYKNAQSIISKNRKDVSPEVLVCSSLESEGFNEIWSFIREFEKIRRLNGSFDNNRSEQKIKAIWRDLDLRTSDYIESELKSKNFVKKIIKDVENKNFDVNNASNIIFNYLKK